MSWLKIDNCTFEKNGAQIRGGAIYLGNFSRADMFNVYFNINIAALGGAMYLTNNSILNANYLSSSKNRAAIGGVTLAVGSCNISCENCVLSENVAETMDGLPFK